MATRTPRPWGEHAWPTAQQLADWLKVCTDNERLIHATLAIRDGQAVDRALRDGFDPFADPFASNGPEGGRR